MQDAVARERGRGGEGRSRGPLEVEAVPGLPAAGPWNDGIFVWTAPSLHGPWKLADTTGIRPDAERGKVWSPEFVGENTPGRTVVAPWQEYWYDVPGVVRMEWTGPDTNRLYVQRRKNA